MKLDAIARDVVLRAREWAGDPMRSIDREKLGPELSGVADDAELVGSEAAVHEIAKALPLAYATDLRNRVDAVYGAIEAFLNEHTPGDGPEWSALFGLLRLVEYLDVESSTATRPPETWSSTPLVHALSAVLEKPIRIRSREELLQTIPADVVDAVLAIRTRFSTPVIAFTAEDLPEALRPFQHQAELLGISDDRLSAAVAAVIPRDYAIQLHSRLMALDNELQKYLAAGSHGEPERSGFAHLLTTLLRVQ